MTQVATLWAAVKCSDSASTSFPFSRIVRDGKAENINENKIRCHQREIQTKTQWNVIQIKQQTVLSLNMWTFNWKCVCINEILRVFVCCCNRFRSKNFNDLKLASCILLLGSWTQEAFEAFSRTQGMDVGQIGWCFRPSSLNRSTQAARVAASVDLPEKSSKVRS